MMHAGIPAFRDIRKLILSAAYDWLDYISVAVAAVQPLDKKIRKKQ